MKAFRKIYLALDLSELDEQLLLMAKYFTKHFATGEVHLVHVIPEFMLPLEVGMEIHAIDAPEFRLDEKVYQEINSRIGRMLSRIPGLHTDIHILEGSPLKKLVELVNGEKGDLLIVGKKKTSGGSGVLAKMVARQVTSPVMFVTKDTRANFENILVPIDFSNYTLNALQTALAFKANRKEVKVTALHIIDFPPTAQYLTRHYGLLAPDWKQRVNNAFDSMLERFALSRKDIDFDTIQNSYFNTARHIQEYAGTMNADLIVMGAKGHSAIDDLFLGSVTEKLVAADSGVPILIVR